MYAKARRYEESRQFAEQRVLRMVQVQGCGGKEAVGGKVKPSVGATWRWASKPDGVCKASFLWAVGAREGHRQAQPVTHPLGQAVPVTHTPGAALSWETKTKPWC